MSSLYLIESTDHQVINKCLDDILKEHNFKKEDLVTYDLDEVNIEDVINDLDTYGFFQESKIIYGNGATFLTTTKSEIDHNIERFMKYVNNPMEGNVLILSCSKMDGKKKVVSLVKDKFTLMNTTINYKDYIKKQTKGYKISYDTINYLLFNTGEDLERLTNEIDKLLLLKLEEKEITRDDIENVVVKNVSDNIFDLIDAIVKKNKKKSLTIYNEMVNRGEEVFKILVSLANQMRLIYQVKTLRDHNDQDIANILCLKNVRQVFAIRQKISGYTSDELIKCLHQLAIMDEELKSGKTIDKVAFPLYIANL